MKLLLAIFLAFPAWGQDYFNIEPLSNWTDTSIAVGPGNVRYSDLWGFKNKGANFAVIGSNEGSHFLKIDDSEILEIQFEQGAFSSPLVQHRDYKKYKNYIYAVCDEGNSTLQIFDISFLPDSVHKVYDSNEHFTICHNIFIDTLNAKLYACGPDNVGLKILDLTIPQAPTLWLNFTAINYIHDCFVNNDTAFLNAGNDGLKVYNFNSNTVPIELGTLNTYQEKGYNHSGWLDETKQVYCFVDETEGKKIKYCELDEGIENIKVDALFGTKDASDFIAHNIYIFNGFAFVAYYNEGLRVFDLRQKPIKQVAYYDSYSEESSYKLHGAWGIYVFEQDQILLLSDRQGGLYSFYFPYFSFRALQNSHQLHGTPFINSKSKLIIDSNNIDNLQFDIYSVTGAVIYHEELVKNWVNIPIDLRSGEYVYKLYSVNSKINYSGKFIIAKQ